MIDDFDKTLDDIINRWNPNIGWYPWEDILYISKSAFNSEDKKQILNKLISDGVLENKSQTILYSLTQKGHDIKRNLQSKGYVAQKQKAEEKEKREEELFLLSKQNLSWTKISAIIFFATLIVAIVATILNFLKK